MSPSAPRFRRPAAGSATAAPRRWLTGWMWRVVLAAATYSCVGPPSSPAPTAVAPVADRSPTPTSAPARCLAAAAPTTAATAGPAPRSAAAPAPTARPRAGERLLLGDDTNTLALPAGRWVVEVAVPAGRYVTIGVAGPRDALAAFEVVGRGNLRRLRTSSGESDGLLPTFVSFRTRTSVTNVLVVLDARAPTRLLRHTVAANDIAPRTPQLLKNGSESARALVGFPYPVENRAGYQFAVPSRYTFVRSDVAAALRAAFRQTRIRYRRNRIAVGDTTQWNGDRPAQDLGKPRHISHQGGRDVDIGLPTRVGKLSILKRRCNGVMVEEGRLECGPGTVRDFDAARAAYLLGLLIDGPTPGGRFVAKAGRRPGPLSEVEVIFTDQAYIDAIRGQLPKLRKRRWIHDEAFGALGEEGLLRASPWHTDHIHIRFRGEAAAVAPVWQSVEMIPPTSTPKKKRARN